jgi:hypothetical protein
MLDFEKKLNELEKCVVQVSEAIYKNSGLIEKFNSNVKYHKSKGNLEEFLDAKEKLERFSAREINLMQEKQLLLKEKILLLELISRSKSEGNSLNFFH